MMDELIRKQTVLIMIDGVQFGNITHKLSQLHEAVRNYPTVDAVEVVRCGECKHMSPVGVCTYFADSKVRPSASDFCSYGERKTDV